MSSRGPHQDKDQSRTDAVRLEKAHVLVVEDDWLIATMNVMLLEEAGAKAFAAPTATAARALLAETQFQVAVLDRKLSDGLSYSVAIEAQKLGAAIIISSGTELLDLPAELELAMILPKPFDGNKLIEAVKEALARV